MWLRLRFCFLFHLGFDCPPIKRFERVKCTLPAAKSPLPHKRSRTKIEPQLYREDLLSVKRLSWGIKQLSTIWLWDSSHFLEWPTLLLLVLPFGGGPSVVSEGSTLTTRSEINWRRVWLFVFGLRKCPRQFGLDSTHSESKSTEGCERKQERCGQFGYESLFWSFEIKQKLAPNQQLTQPRFQSCLFKLAILFQFNRRDSHIWKVREFATGSLCFLEALKPKLFTELILFQVWQQYKTLYCHFVSIERKMY